MGAVNSPLVQWKAGRRPMGAGAGLHLQWKAGRSPGGGSILRRRLQRSNRWGAAKGYAPIESFFGTGFRALTTAAGPANLTLVVDAKPAYGRCMTTPLDALPKIGAPATRALNGAGYVSLSGLAGVPRSALASLHGLGPKALRMIEQALAEHGLGLKQEES